MYHIFKVSVILWVVGVLWISTIMALCLGDINREMKSIRWRLDTIANEAMFMRLCTFDPNRSTCKEAIPGDVKP